METFFFVKMTLLGVIWCEKSIAHFFIFFVEKIGNFSRKLVQDGVFTLRECAQSISRIKITPLGVIFRKKSRKNFFENFSHGWPAPLTVAPIFVIFLQFSRNAEPWICFPVLRLAYFRLNTHTFSLNQSHGSVFKVRQCAQSISCIEKQHIGLF